MFFHNIPPNTSVVGLCSKCNGKVVQYNIWGGIDTPRAFCTSCNSKEIVKKAPAFILPTIEME